LLNLNDREWKEFYLSDIFTISSGKRFVSERMHEGRRPFIGATDSGNGITNFVSDKNESLDRNVLGVNYDGNGMVISFYHPYECIFSDSVKRLHLKKHEDNVYILLFFKTVILQQKSKYNYGYKFNANRMSRQLISIPVDEQGKPDYAFMESYAKEEAKQKKQRYAEYAQKQITELEYKELPLLREKMWRSFRLLDLFDYRRGNQNNMNSLVVGNDMLISAKNMNNGLKGFFVSNNDRKGTYRGNCITLNNDGDGGVGLAYYQPYKFLLDTHVYALYPKLNISKYAMQYITLSLSKQRVCFSHGYSISQDRLKKMRIMLPTDEHDNADYDYMEQYTKNLVLKKYTAYLQYQNAK